MGKINQPNSQIKLTNVSLVRMKKAKKRFELACYQNKVQDYRKGVETDIDEVLQIHQVFINVSKGQVAPNDELLKAFGTTDTDTVIFEILKKGEIQLHEKERQVEIEKLHNEILTIISAKCINPKSKKRYPPTMIDKALKELKFNFTNSRNAKSKALDAIKLLVEKQLIPIARAKMKLRVSLSQVDWTVDKDQFTIKYISNLISTEDKDGVVHITFLLEPENYKPLAKEVKAKKGSVDILDTAVIQEGDLKL
ncbi:guanine nucleotide exchange factor [Martiniozyma asiatica (nom. inval.)]|nr:guanine nucleotide exchange factor [Martiniozyma asiatica]